MDNTDFDYFDIEASNELSMCGDDEEHEEYNKLMKSCCKQCEQCAYYWENTDTENECDGQDEICHEFIEFKGIGH